jgi:hypothetical protein
MCGPWWGVLDVTLCELRQVDSLLWALIIMSSIVITEILYHRSVDSTSCAVHLLIIDKCYIQQGWLFSITFLYLTDFRYFSVKNKFWMLQDMVRTSKKWRFWNRVWMVSAIFHWFSVILFSCKNHSWFKYYFSWVYLATYIFKIN